MKTRNNPGNSWELDYTKLDVHICTADSTANTLSRARLGLIVDAATRMIVGYRLDLSDSDDDENEL